MNKIGLYVHIPFCASKCYYCDFFSKANILQEKSVYTNAVIQSLNKWGKKLLRTADTLYIGGGTPSIIGAESLIAIAAAARASFLLNGAEVTAEVNPVTANEFDLELLRHGGFNRISIGMQSSNNDELAALGRLHSVKDVENTVKLARKAGFNNISLDLMLAIPRQTKSSLIDSVKFCAQLGVDHISAYILKVEQGTPFYANKDKLCLPNDDEQAEMYLLACEKIEELGYKQYEISNFAKPGKESRHNLKYWNGDEYLGIGPAAHSFINKERFFYDRSFDEFYNGITHSDGDGGSIEEYAMLRLRLCEGLTNKGCKEKFGCNIPPKFYKNANKFKNSDLLLSDEKGIRFTKKGFLVSNSLISEIIL